MGGRASIHSWTIGLTASATADLGDFGTFPMPSDMPNAVIAEIVSKLNAGSQASAANSSAWTRWPSVVFCRFALRAAFSFSSSFLFLLLAAASSCRARFAQVHSARRASSESHGLSSVSTPAGGGFR